MTRQHTCSAVPNGRRQACAKSAQWTPVQQDSKSAGSKTDVPFPSCTLHVGNNMGGCKLSNRKLSNRFQRS